MENIFYKKKLVGIKISKLSKGSVPITTDEEPLQLIGLKHPRGAYLKAHYHTSKRLITTQVQECLFVRKGKIKLDIYGPGPNFKYLKYIYLKPGEIFIILNGGYGIHMLKDSELIESKNGPFKNDKKLIQTKK